MVEGGAWVVLESATSTLTEHPPVAARRIGVKRRRSGWFLMIWTPMNLAFVASTGTGDQQVYSVSVKRAASLDSGATTRKPFAS